MCGGDIVDYEVVSACSRLELEAALTAIKERCGAEEPDSFIAELAAEIGLEHPLFDDPQKLLRGLT
jgi:hypothetical protein